MDSEPKEQLSTKIVVGKNHHIHRLRKEYTSSIATEFLHTRKMNKKHVHTVDLNLPLKPHPSLTQESISSLIYHCKTLKSLSIIGLTLRPPSNPQSILLNNFTLHLQSFRCLSKLRLVISLQDRNASKELENLSSALKNMTSLTDLSILFRKDVTAGSFNGFFQTLKYLRYLAALSLAFSDVKQVDDGFMKKFSFSLKTLQNLSSLRLNLYQCEITITDQGIGHLSSALKKIRSLSHITLTLSPLKKLTDQGLAHLSDALYDRHNLRYLHLGLSESKEITNKGTLHLTSVLQELEVLSHLGLDLFNFEEDSDHSLKSFFSQPYYTKSVYLPFYFVRPQDLCEGIVNLKSATKLTLSFFRCNELTDEVLYNLSLGLKPLHKLSKLNLIFSRGDRFTNEGMKEFGSSFQNLMSLTSFKLKLSDCKQIDDTGVKGLLEGIASMKNLKDLTIDLQSMDKITDVSVQSIACCLDALKPSLSPLHLTLKGKFMANSGALKLADSLKDLCCLSSISLEFSFSPNVDNETIRNLLLGLKDLPSLTSLKMDVFYCKNVGEGAVNSLSTILRDFKTLDTVYLNFSKCKVDFKSELHNLVASLKSIYSLSILTLNFNWDYGIDKQLMDSLIIYRRDWKLKFG